MTSCIFSTMPEPYGIWVSSDPELILYIDPASRDIIDAPNYGMFLGRYKYNEEWVDVLVDINTIFESMVIYDLTDMSDEVGPYGSQEYEFFHGAIHVKGDKMLYVVYEAWQEKTGYENIVFEKIEDYPIPEEG